MATHSTDARAATNSTIWSGHDRLAKFAPMSIDRPRETHRQVLPVWSMTNEMVDTILNDDGAKKNSMDPKDSVFKDQSEVFSNGIIASIGSTIQVEYEFR